MRNIIWGLNRAISYMINGEAFSDWCFTLRRRNVFVGYLWYLYERPGGGLDTNMTSTSYNPTETERDIGISGNGDHNSDFVFRMKDLPGRRLSLNDVVMVVIGGLIDIATNDMAV